MVRRTSQALLSCSKMRATRASILNASCATVGGDHPARGVDLVQGKAHPKLRGLVLDDEQHLVMCVADKGVWAAEDPVDVQVVAIGHPAIEGHLRAIFGGVVGGGGHVALQC